MKVVFFILLLFQYAYVLSQDLINPYLDYDGASVTDLYYNSSTINHSANTIPLIHNYNGEYEFLLDKFPWGNQGLISTLSGIDLNDFALSYQIELVSFPFTVDCFFIPSITNPNGGCAGITNDRVFTVMSNSMHDNNTNLFWSYSGLNVPSSNSDQLWNKTPLKIFTRSSSGTFSDQGHTNSLVSLGFGTNSGAEILRTVLPHSILRHTINIHCGPINQPIIGSFSFLTDLTRGRMREYPFRTNTLVSSNNIQDHDLIFRPELVTNNSLTYGQTEISNCHYSRYAQGGKCEDGTTIDDSEGSTVNYTPFDPLIDDFCSLLSQNQNASYGDSYNNNSFHLAKLERLPLADYSLVVSTFPRNFDGTTLAGYQSYPSNTTIQHKINVTPIVHEYQIDKNINLEWINNDERIIYNPSEVNILADNLHFPANYTFKTIRGTFPYKSEVDAAENDPKNGGPFDPTKRDVPVVTDLKKDFHITNSIYSDTDSKYASIYHLISGSKLTIEPCVKIFDATFEINEGAEIVFENWLSNQININRYQLLYKGGTITKRTNEFHFQNENETRRILRFEATDFISAGADVDLNNPIGEYNVDAGASVVFVANNYIDLQPGFSSAFNSTFDVRIGSVNVPPCPLKIRRPTNNYSEKMNQNSENYFSISPNPAAQNAYFMFNLSKTSNAKIIIYDLLGHKINDIGENSFLPSGSYSFKYNLEKLVPGIYFARLITSSNEKTLKFIKV